MKPRPIKIVDGIGYVPLTQGKTAIVDAEDAPFNWHAQRNKRTFYAVRGERQPSGTVYMFRMHTELVGKDVDHEDCNGLNNRRHNLRSANLIQQCQNRQRRSDNTSGFKGVSFHKKRWASRISINGKRIGLGYHVVAEDAARAYDEAAREHFGEFARLNFPREGEMGAR